MTVHIVTVIVINAQKIYLNDRLANGIRRSLRKT